MEEIWKDIKGYEGLYQVSNLGRVKSFDKVVMNKNGKTQTFRGRVLKPIKQHTGYYTCTLFKNTKRKIYLIHRLVADAFILNPLNKPQVDHIDTNKGNNVVGNLRWCTKEENEANPLSLLHRSEWQKNGNCPMSKKIGRKHHSSIQVIRIDNAGNKVYYESIRSVKYDGFDEGGVIDCLKGRKKTYKGFTWVRAE